MAVARKRYERFVDLPAGIQDFFMSQVDTPYENLKKDCAIKDDDFFSAVEDPVLNCVLGFKLLPESLDAVKNNLSAKQIPEDKQDLAVEGLLKNIFWPLREFFGDELHAFLRQNRISTSNWSPVRILYKPISYPGAASEVINRLGLYSTGQKVREKLRNLIEKFSKNQIVETQMREDMVRQPEFDGLGFDAKTADQAIVVIRDLVRTVKMMDEQAYSDYLASETDSASASNLVERRKSPPSQKIDAMVGKDEDAEEIATIRAGMGETPRVVTLLDQAVEDTWNRITEKPTDEYLVQRLRNVISSRLRDVRNATELLSLLQRDTKVGGLGLDRARAEAMAGQVEAAYKESRTKIEAEEKGKFEVQIAEQKRKIEERRRQEAEQHAKWYQEKIKAKQSAETEKTQLAEAWKKQFASAPHPVDAKAAAKEKQQFGELVPVAQPKAATNARPATLVPQPISSVPDLRKVTAKIASAPAPIIASEVKSPVKVSAASVAMSREASPASRMDGVLRPSAGGSQDRLQGLSGELGGLTLAQFRRMGKTPQEATRKISERLETLGKESFEQKVSGIRSWQSCPVMKAYFSLVTASFGSGKPIAEIADTERKEGKDTLTRDEIEALIELNNSLHF